MLTVLSSHTTLWSAHTPRLFFAAPPALTARPPLAERTLPFTVPWCLLRRSWEGRPASFHIYASDAAVISLWLDGSPPRPQEEPGHCPPAAAVFCFHPDTGIQCLLVSLKLVSWLDLPVHSLQRSCQIIFVSYYVLKSLTFPKISKKLCHCGEIISVSRTNQLVSTVFWSQESFCLILVQQSACNLPSSSK